MNILFFSSSFYPSIGGVEKHALRVAQELIQKGHAITIITEYKFPQKNSSWQTKISSDNKASLKKNIDESSFFEHSQLDQIDIYYLKQGQSGWAKKFRIWRAVWAVRQKISQADVVHCHDVFIWYLPFRFLYPFKKVFTTFHGYETVYPPKMKAKGIRKLSELLSKGNICVGEYIKKWYGTKASIVLYGGVDKSSHNRVIRKLTAPYSLIFVGRLDEDTGGRTYLMLLEELKKRKITFTFHVYGQGKLAREFKKYGTLHGAVSDVSLYLREADIVFASSYLSILESLAEKKLVVSVYDNPLKEDYLTMTPFKNYLVLGNNPQALASSVIEYMSSEKKYREQTDAAYKWVQKQTWEKVASSYLTLWKS